MAHTERLSPPIKDQKERPGDRYDRWLSQTVEREAREGAVIFIGMVALIAAGLGYVLYEANKDPNPIRENPPVSHSNL